MDLLIRVRIIFNVKHRYAIKYLINLVPEATASICSKIKENFLLLFSAFIADVII